MRKRNQTREKLQLSFHKKRGVWVFRSGEPLSEAVVQETLRQVRREREQEILGKKR